MDGFRHSLQLHKYPGFKLFLLWYYLVVGESGFLGAGAFSRRSLAPWSAAARGKVGALSSMKHLSGCLSLFYSVAMHWVESSWCHSTTTWTKFFPILTPPPPKNYCGHSVDPQFPLLAHVVIEWRNTTLNLLTLFWPPMYIFVPIICCIQQVIFVLCPHIWFGHIIMTL